MAVDGSSPAGDSHPTGSTPEFRALVEATPGCSFVLDPHGAVVAVAVDGGRHLRAEEECDAVAVLPLLLGLHQIVDALVR